MANTLAQKGNDWYIADCQERYEDVFAAQDTLDGFHLLWIELLLVHLISSSLWSVWTTSRDYSVDQLVAVPSYPLLVSYKQLHAVT